MGTPCTHSHVTGAFPPAPTAATGGRLPRPPTATSSLPRPPAHHFRKVRTLVLSTPDASALELRLESDTLLRSILADDGLILAFQQHIAHTRVMADSVRVQALSTAARGGHRHRTACESADACLCMSCLTVCEEYGNSGRVELLIHRAGVMRAVVEITGAVQYRQPHSPAPAAWPAAGR